MAHHLPSSRVDRAKRRAAMLKAGEIFDPAMMRVVLAEVDGMQIGKKSTRRRSRRSVA